MELNTMASVMSYVSKIENASSLFYKNCAEKHSELKDIVLSWAKENEKFERMIKQTYFGVITDSLEACYSFEGLATENYDFVTTLLPDASLSATKEKAREIEDKMKNFYYKAAEISEGLMADIPRLFRKIGKIREQRCLSIDSL